MLVTEDMVRMVGKKIINEARKAFICRFCPPYVPVRLCAGGDGLEKVGWCMLDE